MPGSPNAEVPFSYCILRVVPSVERGERMNVGVVMFCRQRRFLGGRVQLDSGRLAALGGGPGLDWGEVAGHLEGMLAVAEGRPDAGAIAALDASDRFGWLAAPSSTVVQPSEVHTGLCDDPDAVLAALFTRLVVPGRT